MKLNTILATFISVYMVFAVLGSTAQAYQFYSDNTNDQGGCAQCHTGFRDNANYFSHAEGIFWGDSLHNIHLANTDVETSCDNCHGGAGTSRRTVNISSSANAKDGVNAIACSGCHGRLEDANTVTAIGTGWGAGLRQHHETSTNPMAGAGTCSGCHADADPAMFTPTNEDTMPPWYASVVNTTLSNIPMAPCSMNGEENFSLNGTGLDNDGDHLYDTLDPDCSVPLDSDGDGILDNLDNCPNTANTNQTDTDNDGYGDACDLDDDNDGVPDAGDTNILDPMVCSDTDADQCDDCAVGVDGFGIQPDNNPDNDGVDTDADGACNMGDLDDDNDGVPDVSDLFPLNPNEQADTDGDGTGDNADPDADNDGILDGADTAWLNPNLCADTDADQCDDCAVGVDGFGVQPDNNPDNDGIDTDADGACNTGDLDDDNDGVPDTVDFQSLDPFSCSDTDNDLCDDCSVGADGFGPLADVLPADDGPDYNADGICDLSDPPITADGDLNDDGVVNAADVLLAKRMLLGQIPSDLLRGDVAPQAGGVPASDGLFNLGDVLLIQRKALGQISF